MQTSRVGPIKHAQSRSGQNRAVHLTHGATHDQHSNSLFIYMNIAIS